MKTFLLILSLILLLFPSCSPDTTISDRDIYLISVADDFKGGTELKTVVSDQAALISQIETIGNVHVYSFVSQHGKRYMSVPTDTNPEKTPLFKPVDSSCNELSSPSDTSFDHFEYVPSSAETEVEWTMDTVFEEIGKIHSGENDLIIFTYSGHGDTNGALATNYGSSGKYRLTNKEEIISKFSSLSGNKIFFLDSCYSGNFIPDSTLNTTDTFTTKEDHYEGEDYLKGIQNSTLTKTEDTQPSLWIMASAGRKQKASDSLNASDSAFQEHYGAFSYYLLKALGYNMEKNEREAKSSSLTFYSIYSYIMSVFPSYELKIQTPRTSLKRLDIRLR